MATFRRGKVESVEERGGLLDALVATGEETITAVAFPDMSGPLRPGDVVIVNTTGIDLGLGTGGVAFVLCNLDAPDLPGPGPGHIMKLRYTPWQMNVRAAEAPEGAFHNRLQAETSVGGMPVVCCSLHSQVAAVAAGIKAAAPDARVGYLMTDGGALPLKWSQLVGALTDAGLLDVTCTAGHAFGGDLESVNVYSGLAALRHGAGAEVAIVAVGPGVVGTGTALGHTAMEQGQNLDAAAALGGRAVAALRISFDDVRSRHRGLSHHSVGALTIAARERALVAVPKLPPREAQALAEALEQSGICDRHDTKSARGDAALALLAERRVELQSMGRQAEDAPHLFLAGGAAGRIAAELIAAG